MAMPNVVVIAVFVVPLMLDVVRYAEVVSTSGTHCTCATPQMKDRKRNVDENLDGVMAARGRVDTAKLCDPQRTRAEVRGRRREGGRWTYVRKGPAP